MLYCSSECGSISITQLRTIYCNIACTYISFVLMLYFHLHLFVNPAYFNEISWNYKQHVSASKHGSIYYESCTWYDCNTTWCANCPDWDGAHFPEELADAYSYYITKSVILALSNVWYEKGILANVLYAQRGLGPLSTLPCHSNQWCQVAIQSRQRVTLPKPLTLRASCAIF